MVDDRSISPITEVNETLIPVDIWIQKAKDDSQDAGKWVLTGSCYLPRKSFVTSNYFEVVADTAEELRNIVRTNVLPLYQAAVAQLTAIHEGREDHLYYWETA